MTGQPNKEFIFFWEVQIPNPGPRLMRVGSGASGWVGEEPIVAAFSSINSIFVVRPNKSVVYGFVESDIDTVDVVSNLSRKRGVKNIGVRCGTGKDILDGEVEVMNVNIRDGVGYVTCGGPISEPKGGGTAAMSPSIAGGKQVLCTNNGCPGGGAARMISGEEQVRGC
jgi:hypothetical protein